MFPADMADFYQIFFHIKQIIWPPKSQPYIKKTRKSSDSIDTKFFWYFPSLFGIASSIIVCSLATWSVFVDQQKHDHVQIMFLYLSMIFYIDGA